MIGTVSIDDDKEVVAYQRFVDNEPFRAARRGQLIVDKFASRRRFEGWGAWAQDRIRVSRSLVKKEVRQCRRAPGRMNTGVLGVAN